MSLKTRIKRIQYITRRWKLKKVHPLITTYEIEKDLSYEAQIAITLFQVLPDKIEGMAGVWLGKDFSGLGDIMELYGIEGNREAFNLLLHIIAEASKFYEQQRKTQQARKN
mgnify:CR=1 FL=1